MSIVFSNTVRAERRDRPNRMTPTGHVVERSAAKEVRFDDAAAVLPKKLWLAILGFLRQLDFNAPLVKLNRKLCCMPRILESFLLHGPTQLNIYNAPRATDK